MPQITRRELLQLATLGASGAALAGCKDKTQEFLEAPLQDLRQPAGLPVVFASICKSCPQECGLHARVKEGRLKKLEGNPSWPGTAGALCALGQAGPQILYHPRRAIQARLRTDPQQNGAEAVTMKAAMDGLVSSLQDIPGDRVVCLLPPQTGHVHALIEALEWKPFVLDASQPRALTDAAMHCYAAGRLHYPLDQAKVVLSFGADLVSQTPLAAALGRWRRQRRAADWAQARFIQIEPRFSVTAASADHWLAPKPGSEGVLALALARAVAQARDRTAMALALAEWTPERAAQQCDLPPAQVEALIRRVTQTAPALAIPGSPLGYYAQGPLLARAVGILNRLLEAPVSFGFQPPLEGVSPPRPAALREVAAAIRLAAAVVIVDLDIATQFPELRSVLKTPTIYMTTRDDATTADADLVIPLSTFLETWDDAFPESTAVPVAGIVQPVVNSYAGVGLGDLLLQLLRVQQEGPGINYREYLRRRWTPLCPDGEDVEVFWTRLCAAGRWENPQPRPVRPNLPPLDTLVPQMPASQEVEDGLYLYLYPSPIVGHGSRADLPWLQERFDVLSGVAWCSPLEIHPTTASSLDLTDGDVVAFRVGETDFQAPVILTTSIRPDTVALPLGAPDTVDLRKALAGNHNGSGDPQLNGWRVTLRKVDKRNLARVGHLQTDLGRGLAQLERRGS